MGIPIPEFKILLYGPALHPAGIRGRARFEGNTLAITARNTFFLVEPERITLRTGGYDGRQWLITWVSAEGTHSAMLQGEDALSAFIQLAPPELSQQLAQARASHARIGRRFTLGLVLFVLISILLAGLLWLNADKLGQWVVSRISVEREQQLGDLAFAQLRPSLTLQTRGSAPEVVAAIGKRLAGESIYTYRFHVAIDPEINAYALPGGHIVVNTGLLDAADSAAEVAGVLAHEISHVEQRHTLRNLVLALGWRAMLGAATGDFSGGYWSEMAARLVSLGYSRKLESEADREGLEILRRAAVAPHGMASFFEKLAARRDTPPSLLSSHPADKERLAALRAAISNQPPADLLPLGVDWERLELER